jgi:hypothetical protein
MKSERIRREPVLQKGAIALPSLVADVSLHGSTD